MNINNTTITNLIVTITLLIMKDFKKEMKAEIAK